MKVAKSIGLIYKLNSFSPKLFLKRYTLRHSSILIIWYRGISWNISKLYL